ncbi:MAG: hypothetical protein JRH20_25785 [Deltaproteobacteria bacterium]|nr:hypothetical protein [Deltaproteobacteria bacterium]
MADQDDYTDPEGNLWVPGSVEELEKLFAYLPKYGDRAEPAKVEEDKMIMDLPFMVNIWPLSVPDFHIPLKPGTMETLRSQNTLLMSYAAKREVPPRSLLNIIFRCIDQSKTTTPRIQHLFDTYIKTGAGL